MAQRFFVSNVSVACAVPGVGFLLQARAVTALVEAVHDAAMMRVEQFLSHR